MRFLIVALALISLSAAADARGYTMAVASTAAAMAGIVPAPSADLRIAASTTAVRMPDTERIARRFTIGHRERNLMSEERYKVQVRDQIRLT